MAGVFHTSSTCAAPLPAFNLVDVTTETMREMLAGVEDFAQRDMIFKILENKILLGLGLNAAGIKGNEACQRQCAKIFFDRLDKHKEAARLRNMDSKQTPNNAEQIKRWVGGDVYLKKDQAQADIPETEATPDTEAS
jgi:hypothetical protein